MNKLWYGEFIPSDNGDHKVMFVVVSPAKKMTTQVLQSDARSTPVLSEQTIELANVMKQKTSADLQQLMKISEKLGDLNAQRFTDFDTSSPSVGEPAVGLFAGDTYVGLDAASLSGEDLEFAQQHLGILSGLYGVLAPMDRIQPYRLEMGTRLVTDKGANLVQFWGEQVTDVVGQKMSDAESKTLINLASNEYFSVLNPQRLQEEYGVSVVTPVFKEVDRKNGTGKLRIISFNAKRARGMMARYIVQQRLTEPDGIKEFGESNYVFRADLSSEHEWVFVR